MVRTDCERAVLFAPLTRLTVTSVCRSAALPSYVIGGKKVCAYRFFCRMALFVALVLPKAKQGSQRDAVRAVSLSSPTPPPIDMAKRRNYKQTPKTAATAAGIVLRVAAITPIILNDNGNGMVSTQRRRFRFD